MPLTKDDAKTKLAELIEKHQRFKNEGRLKGINEETTKQWIDDLFRILGWDFIEDVVKEYGTGKRKRVDYAFQITGTTKFLLEAKAYGEELEDKYIKQTLEYGYQNNKTWVVLTNFREIRVYNAKYYDKEEHIRRLYEPIRIEDVVARIDDLWVLSRDGMKEGLISQLANKYGKIKPKEAIDSLIFEDLLRWRKALEKGIKEHERLNHLPTDPEAGEKYIDEAVQKILDRIIFVRVCEDRGLEEEELLRWCVREWKADKKYPLMSYLSRLFSKKNSEYNSGIFAAHYSETLTIENEALETIIEESYVNPNGLTYDFSAIDADILGTIYENYLAYIQKKVWDKESKQKSKRKAHGIYYTPTYIVDYIVKNTLGEKLKACSKPEEALKIKVLDPACGSGSFLIRSYDEFKNWYASHMKKNGEKQHTLNQELKGTTEFMDKVLENCIYGVDLDPKAVEIAQLNLLLKSAEGKHKLPTLNHTVQCGNSLIDDPAVAGERAFKWEEKFPEVFKNGGFDVVVGNPPYFSAETLAKNEKEHLQKYACYAGKSDILYFFYNKGIVLLKSSGILGFITSRYFIEATYAKNLRQFITEHCSISKIIDLSNLPVFKDVGIHTVIFVVNKQEDNSIRKNNLIFFKNVETIQQLHEGDAVSLPQAEFGADGWTLGTKSSLALFKKIDSGNSIRLGDISTIEQGQKSGLNEAFTVDILTISKYKLEKEFIRKLVKNSYIKPYFIEDKGLYLIYASDELTPKNAPNILEYLSQFKIQLKMRAEACDGLYPWYRLQRPREKILFDKTEKIVVPYRAERNRFGYDNQQRYNDGGDIRIIVINNSEYNIKYILGILNSQLMNFYYRFIGRKKGNSLEYFVEPLKKIPIVKADSKSQETISALADKIIQLNTKLDNISNHNSNEAHSIRVEIEKIDKEIDRLVYELYGLTEDEIQIVEEAVK